ncbi:sperm-associated antigen 7 homolog [Montipora capricornis]|uniref:sperm-associated antigen 7 homolog n=1 Tax=Montipora capricornis TaxID=246305 RepID=UPI0035F2173F
MDLLGSILKSMDAPPTTEVDKKAKEERVKLKKLQMQEKKKNAVFRAKTEKEVTEFIKDTKQTRMKFPPMTRIQRSIVHDVAEIAGLTTFSFGEDEIDRYVMLFKKEFPPSDEELEAYRNGEEFDPDSTGKSKDESQSIEDSDSVEVAQSSTKHSKQPPPTYYKDKYKHLLGSDSGKDAARATKSNSAYGYVPSENKRDLRSIEETLNDIRKRKKLKPGDTDDDEEQDREGKD